MAAEIPPDALFCANIGAANASTPLDCCTISNQTSQTCQTNFFNKDVHTFDGGCSNKSCIAECQDRTTLYSSKQQEDPYLGNGFGPIRRFLTCANVPNMAGYLDQDVLDDGLDDAIRPYVEASPSEKELEGITLAVTECLSFTCRSARNRTDCRGRCSATNLLINNTHPNIQGLNGCLNSLCTRGYDSLPYADADVIGIGVFASYIMQCMFVVIFWFGLAAFYLYKQRHPIRYSQPHSQSQSQPEKPTTTDDQSTDNPKRRGTQACAQSERKGHQVVFEDFLVQFHKAQCYFSSTLQIASLSYGIFDTDMLVTFSLVPIATNGVLPVVFAFVLLFRCDKSSMDITILTVCTWGLSSLVYWILYSHVIPINQDFRSEDLRYRAYQQFMYKLTALDACGGYSALAVCPKNFELGRQDISDASHNLRAMTPIIWSFSSICLMAILFGKFIKWRRDRPRTTRYQQVKRGLDAEGEIDKDADAHPGTEEVQNNSAPLFRTHRTASIAYWITTICFLAGIGMQLSLLSIGTSLNMMNRSQWSFGQIVAVTIWAEPLLGYLYDEVKELLWSRFNIGNVPR